MNSLEREREREQNAPALGVSTQTQFSSVKWTRRFSQATYLFLRKIFFIFCSPPPASSVLGLLLFIIPVSFFFSSSFSFYFFAFFFLSFRRLFFSIRFRQPSYSFISLQKGNFLISNEFAANESNREDFPNAPCVIPSAREPLPFPSRLHLKAKLHLSSPSLPPHPTPPFALCSKRFSFFSFFF